MTIIIMYIGRFQHGPEMELKILKIARVNTTQIWTGNGSKLVWISSGMEVGSNWSCRRKQGMTNDGSEKDMG